MNINNKLPEVEIFSDWGSNPNPGRWWYWVILHYKWIKKEFSAGYKLTTNNRMELTWVITWLKKLNTKAKVDIYTDSQYTINWIEKWWAKKWKENNWYRTKNEKAINYDLWEILLDLVEKHEVKFHWVKWHNWHIENERCDELATKAMSMDNLLEDTNYLLQTEDILQTTNIINDKQVTLNKVIDKNIKITKSWDLCRKCNTPVEKKQPKHIKKPKPWSYYYEYYLLCPSCKTMYMVEEAKIYT